MNGTIAVNWTSLEKEVNQPQNFGSVSSCRFNKLSTRPILFNLFNILICPHAMKTFSINDHSLRLFFKLPNMHTMTKLTYWKTGSQEYLHHLLNLQLKMFSVIRTRFYCTLLIQNVVQKTFTSNIRWKNLMVICHYLHHQFTSW